MDAVGGQSEPKKSEIEIAALAEGDPAFKTLLAGGATPVQALMRRGTQLIQEKRLPEAVAWFRSATLLAPDDPECWTNYGVALDRTNALTEAAEALEHSLAISRSRTDTWLLLGLTRAKQGQGDAAEAAYRAVMEMEPKSPLVWQCLGLLREGQKRYTEAIDSFLICIQKGGATASLCANLGKLLHQTGRIVESCRAYSDAVALEGTNAHYRETLRKVTLLRDLLEGDSVDAAMATYRGSLGSETVPDDKQMAELYHIAFGFLSGFGHREAAARVGKRHLELWPDSPSMDYLLKAVKGGADLDRSPVSYITEHFDAFAAGFDVQLVGALGYDVPEKIAAAIRAAGPPDRLYDAVDVGCGTGLCGPLLRSCSRTLAGVDLSPKMLEQAGKRKIYDELLCEELTAFLGRSPEEFDLIVAADVLIYFGDLTEPLAAAAKALRPGGILAFSTESLAEGTYQLLHSGRFAHSAAYIRALAASAFTEHAWIETTSRLEATARVPADIFILRRRQALAP